MFYKIIAFTIFLLCHLASAEAWAEEEEEQPSDEELRALAKQFSSGSLTGDQKELLDLAKKFTNGPIFGKQVWVVGIQNHMAYDSEAEVFMAAPGLHGYAISHSSGMVLGLSMAYFANADYSMGVFEALVGYDVTQDATDVHVLLSSGLGIYGYGNSDDEVAALSLPMKFHLDFSDKVLVYLGTRLYYDFWSHSFPFDFGIAMGF